MYIHYTTLHYTLYTILYTIYYTILALFEFEAREGVEPLPLGGHVAEAYAAAGVLLPGRLQARES